MNNENFAPRMSDETFAAAKQRVIAQFAESTSYIAGVWSGSIEPALYHLARYHTAHIRTLDASGQRQYAQMLQALTPQHRTVIRVAQALYVWHWPIYWRLRNAGK